MNYDRETMLKAFNRVQNAENWKNPINSYCDEKDIDLVTEAVIYFTGSVPSFRKVNQGWAKGKYHVTADGYYIAIGA